MANKRDHHTGSGIHKPDPEGLLEKVGEGLKSVLSEADPSGQVMPREKGIEPAQGALT